MGKYKKSSMHGLSEIVQLLRMQSAKLLAWGQMQIPWGLLLEASLKQFGAYPKK